MKKLSRTDRETQLAFKEYKQIEQVFCPHLKTKVVFNSGGFRHFFGFIAIINNWKIKVIVKKMGQEEPFFWSVIPNWVTSPKRDKIFYGGSLEED